MLDPDDPRHGTAAYYGHHGCRCDACRQANTEKRRRDRGGPETRSTETKETRMADETWRAEAKCRDMPTDIFFPTRGEDLRPARLVCNGTEDSPPCPVKMDCLEYALNLTGVEDTGVWAGLGERERRRIRSNRARARRFDGRAAG